MTLIKDMKMKKLTALALAGVLCLGMSTTAFAASSPGSDDATYAIDENGKKLEGIETNSPVDTGVAGGRFDTWTGKDANKNIKKDLGNRLEEITDLLDPEENENYGDLKYDEIKSLEAEKKTLEDLDLNGMDFIFVRDIDVDPTKITVDEDNAVTVRFDLTGHEGIAKGDWVHIMHQIDGYWVVTDAQVDLDSNGFYVTQDFNKFSPVAIIKFTPTNDKPIVTPPANDPTDQPTVTPDTNGNITADQLADLIVKKLQQSVNATKTVRTVSGKASPKTGE